PPSRLRNLVAVVSGSQVREYEDVRVAAKRRVARLHGRDLGDEGRIELQGAIDAEIRVGCTDEPGGRLDLGDRAVIGAAARREGQHGDTRSLARQIGEGPGGGNGDLGQFVRVGFDDETRIRKDMRAL